MDNQLFHNLVAEQTGIVLNDRQVSQFELYEKTLLQWNKKVNLTRITSPQDIVIKHFLDSLSVIPFIEKMMFDSILDVGSGAGFPGIPLGIVLPQKSLTLLDASRKRVHFLKYTTHLLGANNFQIIQGRLELFKPENLFDIVICRAFAELSKFVMPSSALVKPSGRIIAMKGKSIHNELETFQRKDLITCIESYILPNIDQKRYLVFF